MPAENGYDCQVAGVVLDGSQPRLVDLHLTPHHTILTHSTSKEEEIWISHSLLLSIHLHATARDTAQARTPLVLRGRDYTAYTLLFGKKSDAKNVYESLEAVIAKRLSTDQLYAFCTKPDPANAASWNVYDPKREYARMGVIDSSAGRARTAAWRFTSVNTSYEYCPTYPSQLVVPSKISDATLNYGKSYRSKARVPGLVYLHWANLGSITRASQPMVGLKNNRSIQDEKLIEAIFTSHSHHSSVVNNAANSYISHSASSPVYGATSNNLIIDARPTTNAMANVAKGAGTENMEHYRNCKKVYLGIDNIHVMRDSLARVSEAIRQPNSINHDLLRRSGWLKHLSCILEGILIIVKAVHLANSHVLVHCSDGWDRTSQLSALSQLCLDPYYRTMEGLAVLTEKDWVSFGHKFGDRSGHTVPQRVQCVYTADEEDEDVGFLASMQQRLNFSGSSHAFKETCPVFDQFLDSIHQLQRQFPERFQYNELFLLELQRQLYECRFGNFLYNSEKERVEAGVAEKTASIWHDLLDPRNANKYTNPAWQADDSEVLFPDPKNVKWWTAWFKREDMNTVELPLAAGLPGDPLVVESKQEDPVLRAVPSLGASVSRDTDTSNGDTSKTAAPQTALDSAVVAQAGTAVQGAMRSAWSAWGRVKQGYDGMMKEMNEAQITSAEQSQQTRPSISRPASPAKLPIPAARSGSLSNGATPTAPRSPAFGASNLGPALGDLQGFRSQQHTTPRRQPSAPAEENPWKSSESDSDPLGVKVWS